MCDLHLTIYMLLYVYVAYLGNAAVKSWLAPISATVAPDGNYIGDTLGYRASQIL
jgi:hypothetical protein